MEKLLKGFESDAVCVQRGRDCGDVRSPSRHQLESRLSGSDRRKDLLPQEFHT